MLLIRAPTSVVLQIVGISILMIILSQWFSRKFSVSAESQMQTQMLVQDLQDQLRAAQNDNNSQLIAQINEEMMVLLREMSKKQFLPMIIRSIAFFAIWGLMKLLYGNYDEYIYISESLVIRSIFTLYLIIALLSSVVITIGKKLYLKMHPEKKKNKELVVDKIRALQSNIIYTSENPTTNNAQNQYSDASSSSMLNSDLNTPQIKKEKGWKERLEQ
ncbi:MAG: hypothetical protein DRO88_04210 [Promethearchaeia archaeon]|nr:MAG: hypothetical protein DRO88_04210 [Candidatus Lokiarchaeia archaeon]